MSADADLRPGAKRRILLLSVALQLALGLAFGHDFDTRGFMVGGYTVGTGGNPYAWSDLSAVFHHVRFENVGPAGYPPPWQLVLGLLYLASYAVVPDLLLYNLALKLPVIAANVGLAYLVATVLEDLGASPSATRRAWVLMLFNPVLLYFGAAWGQIDGIAAALALGALTALWARRTSSSSALLALSVTLKPVTLPVLPAVLVFLWRQGRRPMLRYAGVFVLVSTALVVAPFAIFGWDASAILRGWNGHFTLTGGLALPTAFRLLRDPLELPGWWWLVGLVWIPALAVAAVALRHGDTGLEELLKVDDHPGARLLPHEGQAERPELHAARPARARAHHDRGAAAMGLRRGVRDPAGVHGGQPLTARSALPGLPGGDGVVPRMGRALRRRGPRRQGGAGRRVAGRRLVDRRAVLQAGTRADADTQVRRRARGGRTVMAHAPVDGAVRVPLDDTLTLELGEEPVEARGYPTARLQKGLVLVDAGAEPGGGGRGVRCARPQAGRANGLPRARGVDVRA